MTTKYEPTVPLSEFGLERMTSAELAAYAHLADVTVLTDYLDRPAVSLSDAYAIAESRRAAEAAWAASESRRLREHDEAVKSLQQRVNAAFVEARTARLAASVGANLWGGQTERDGTAVNAGLESARMVWATAPAAVRDAVASVEYEENGLNNVVPLNLAMPLALINAYAAKAARKY